MDVDKSVFVVGLIIAAGAMLVLPITIGHMVKASTCSASSSKHGDTVSDSLTNHSGGCSTTGDRSQH